MDYDDDDKSIPFKIYARAKNKVSDIFLSDSIEGDGTSYFDLLKAFDEATPGDEIILHLANFGGACHSGFRICHAMRASQAAIVVKVDAPCYSMGAIIALAGDALVMLPGTFLMFHNYSGGSRGKGDEMLGSIKEYAKHFHYSLDHFCSPFLTAKERERLITDRDVYVHAQDANLGARIKKHFS